MEDLEDCLLVRRQKNGLTLLPCVMPFSSCMDDGSKMSFSQFWQFMQEQRWGPWLHSMGNLKKANGILDKVKRPNNAESKILKQLRNKL